MGNEKLGELWLVVDQLTAWEKGKNLREDNPLPYFEKGVCDWIAYGHLFSYVISFISTFVFFFPFL